MMSLFRKLLTPGKPDLAAKAGHTAPGLPSVAAERLLTQVHDLIRNGQYPGALRLVGQGLSEHPQDSELAYARASALLRAGRVQESARAFNMAATMGPPSRAGTCLDMGWAQLQTGNPGEAEASMAQSVSLEPTSEGYRGLASARHARNDFAGAIASAERCLELDPSDVEAYVLAGSCEMDRGDPVAAERYLRRGIAVDPLAASCWLDLGVALDLQDRYDDALAAYREADRVDRLRVGTGGAVANLAASLRNAGRAVEALECLDGDDHPPDAHRQYVHAAVLSTLGRLGEAWEFHEFRWGLSAMLSKRAGLADIPPWVGQDLRGKTILLRAEQGLGDTIQFLRYAPWLKRLGATVHVRVQAPLESLAGSFHGVDKVQTPRGQNSAVDYYVHPMSLGKMFGTELQSIPATIPYVDVDLALRARWAQRLPASTDLKVGIVWAGSPEHQRDRHRSIRLSTLAPLFQLEGVSLHSLQKGGPVREIGDFEHADRLDDLASDLTDLGQTAAAIACLDLIICVDTSVAHLAGALGRPVWMLAAAPADFRWMLDRADSPWYPSMRIFRQAKRGAWDQVVDDVATALREVREAGDGRLVPLPERKSADSMPAVRHPTSGVIAGTTRITEARYGLMEYLPDEPVVGPSIACYGEYRQEELLEVLRRCRPGSTVLEIAPGVGHSMLPLAIQVGDAGHVLAYEPRHRKRAALLHNLASNRCGNVTVLSRSPRGMAVPSGPLEHESVDDLQLDALAWLLVNADADPIAVLDGASETMWRCRPLALLRVPSPEALHRASQVSRSFSYRCWGLETALFHPQNFNRWPHDIFDGRTTVALVAVPEEVEITPGTTWVALD